LVLLSVLVEMACGDGRLKRPGLEVMFPGGTLWIAGYNISKAQQ
jgi:hypothetical protein